MKKYKMSGTYKGWFYSYPFKRYILAKNITEAKKKAKNIKQKLSEQGDELNYYQVKLLK